MADFSIQQCPPSARAAEILALFQRAGQPEFATVYERVYRVREPLGLRSWVGVSGDQVALHMSVAPEAFSGGPRPLTAGLLGDLMADEAHRNFWSPLKLVRRMVADVRANRTADFLITSYAQAAEAVFKAAGFRKYGELYRHVLPLTWPYPLLRRLVHRGRVPRLIAIPFGEAQADAFLGRLGSPGCFRPIATAQYFDTRMPRSEYPAGTWLLAGSAESPEAVVLVSPKPQGELVIADVLWRDADAPLAGVFLAVARWAARQGHRRVTVTTAKGSRVSVAAQRAGFLIRPGPWYVMMLALCTPETIPPPEEWSFTPFVLTSW